VAGSALLNPPVSSAYFIANRPNNASYDAGLMFRTGGANKWAAGMLVGSTGGTSSADSFAVSYNNGAAWVNRLNIDASGNVGVGTTNATHKLEVGGDTSVTGNLTVAGAGNITASGAITGATVNAVFQDVAEWFPSTQKLTAGTVVVLDTDRTNHVLASTKAYDTGVAGVVSASPGVILGQGGTDMVKVAKYPYQITLNHLSDDTALGFQMI
jgi:hypothetical protein